MPTLTGGSVFPALLLCCALAADGGDLYSWRDAEGYRFAKLDAAAPSNDIAGFCVMDAASSGIRFTNSLATEKLLNNHNLLNGSGVAAGDYDDDGRVDLFFSGVGGRSGLYRNLGNWKLEETTDAAGVACAGMAATGAAFVDIDGDGALDLFVTSCGGPNAFFRNLGGGRFTNMTEAVGFAAKTGSTSMAFADIDRDGDLDVYVANYGENTIRSGMPFSTRVVGGREVVTGRNANRLKIIQGKLVEFGEPDFIGLNDGTGRFAPLPYTGGAFLGYNGQPLTQALWDLGLSAMFRDINGDLAPDLYVCNDFQTPDRIWINNGGGKFAPLPHEALPYSSWFAMAVDFADINRDGHLDFFVADMDERSRKERLRKMPAEMSPLIEGEWENRPQYRKNTLALNRGDGTFAEISELAGLAATEWTWSAVFLDVDLDGYEDLLIGNGHAYDTEDQDTSARFAAMKQTRAQTKTNLLAFPLLTPPNVVFRNNRDLTFTEMGASWGFTSTNVSHGMCLADLDNDGDQDVIINAFQSAPLLYRNESMAGRIAVRLAGAGKNSRGIGAKIEVKSPKLAQSQEMIAGGRYLSSDDPLRTFAAFDGASIEVSWPSGRRSVVNQASANHIYEIKEPASGPATAGASDRARRRAFVEVPVTWRHTADDSDDFARQPMLVERINRAGPPVVACDWNRDGRMDLVVGGNRGAAPVLLAGPNFTAALLAPGMTLKGGAYSIAVITNSGPAAVITEEERMLIVSGAKVSEIALPGIAAGPVAAGDVDGDGDTDLFVGARFAAGKFPQAAGSKLLLNNNGSFEIAPSDVFANAGLVNGAVFADLNGDGAPDLALACGWGPIRIYLNEKGKFADAPERFGIKAGLWNDIAASDFDGDGKVDLVASNLGRNHRWQRYRPAPARLYYGDFDSNETIEVIEALVEGGRVGPMAVIQRLARGLPGLQQRFSSAAKYSEASVEEVLGEAAAGARWMEAAWFESTVFLNRGSKFEAHPLPVEAQFAPGFGLAVADFNGDARLDIFMAQNFSGTSPDYAPMNSGRGVMMLGDGKGNFTALSNVDSGISISGDQRGCAAADFDGDAKTDLAVGVNGGPLKIFRNVLAAGGGK